MIPLLAAQQAKALEPEKVLLLPDGVEDQWSDALADLIALA